MARSSGTYSLPLPPVVTGTAISSSWANSTLSDIATELTNSLPRDGQAAPTANIPMGGYKFTNVGNGSARTDSASLGQIQDSAYLWLTYVSGSDTITASVTPNMTAYASGQSFWFVSAGANTGAVTININSIGAKSITKFGSTVLAAGDIPSGAVCEITYDGTRFQLAHAYTVVAGQLSDSIVSDLTAVTIASDDYVAIADTSDSSKKKKALVSDITALSPQLSGHRGLKIVNNSSNPNYQLDITADEIIVKNASGAGALLTSFSATVDITASGVNGLDTGSEASGTWYFIWAIYDGTNKKGLLSTSSTAPTMPGSYTYKTLLGAIYNNGSSNFVKIAQRGLRVGCEPQLAQDGATGQTSYTSLSLANYVPSIAVTAKGNMGPKTSGLRGMVIAADGNGVGACVMVPGSGSSALDGFVNAGTYSVELITAQTIYWKSIDTLANNYSISVTGWSYA